MAELRLPYHGLMAAEPVLLVSTQRARSENAVQMACAAILVASVLFNPALAWVNAHVAPINGMAVSLVQALIVIGALALGMLQPLQDAARWAALTWVLVAGVAITSALRMAFDPKILGDVLIIPAFILLGTRMRGGTLRHCILGLQGFILAVGVWELAAPQSFGRAFDVLHYYVNTRGYEEDAFWAGGELFLSAARPGGRMLLDGFNLHRGSSVFLEPVSLGNWCIIAAAFTAAMWQDFGWRARAFMVGTIAGLLAVCDGRLATSLCLLFALYLPFARFIPDRWSFLYLPGMLAAMMLGEWLGLLDRIGDNIVGRLYGGLKSLQSLDVQHLMGLATQRIRMDDSGWGDFVQAQSLVMALLLWVVLTLTNFGPRAGDRMAKHAIMLFLTLCMPISNSVLSIKTAALMWVVYGFCYARARLAGDRRFAQ
ncbi:MAG: polysaccharide biosynthesis protein GumE [Sphingobium sp.]